MTAPPAQQPSIEEGEARRIARAGGGGSRREADLPGTVPLIVIDFGTFMSTALLIALALLPLVPVVLMFLHAARTPAWVWAFTDHTQVVWVAMLLAGIVITPVGLVLAIWYFLKIRPVLDARERGEL